MLVVITAVSVIAVPWGAKVLWWLRTMDVLYREHDGRIRTLERQMKKLIPLMLLGMAPVHQQDKPKPTTGVVDVIVHNGGDPTAQFPPMQCGQIQIDFASCDDASNRHETTVAYREKSPEHHTVRYWDIYAGQTKLRTERMGSDCNQLNWTAKSGFDLVTGAGHTTRISITGDNEYWVSTAKFHGGASRQALINHPFLRKTYGEALVRAMR